MPWKAIVGPIESSTQRLTTIEGIRRERVAASEEIAVRIPSEG